MATTLDKVTFDSSGSRSPAVALEAVGLTAAVSQALAQAGISCNIVAGYYHDHLFVPADEAKRALEVLEALARSNQQTP